MDNLIGSMANHVPTNSMHGGLAFQDTKAFSIEPCASVTPTKEGQLVFELVSDTSLNINVMGSDGIVRSTNLTLA